MYNKKVLSYILRMVVAKSYQQDKVQAIKMVGLICDIIKTCPIMHAPDKDEMITAVTECFYNMWVRSYVKDEGGYDE